MRFEEDPYPWVHFTGQFPRRPDILGNGASSISPDVFYKRLVFSELQRVLAVTMEADARKMSGL